MSDYHLLESAEKDQAIRVAFHVPVPDELNSVGVNLRTALTQYQPFTTSAVPAIDTTEQASLEKGELYEHVRQIKYTAAWTNSQKQSHLDAYYTNIVTKIQKKLRAVLKYWGHSRDVS